MDLFKLFGTIAIDNEEANDSIDDTTDRAKDSSESIVKSFKKIGTAVLTYFAVDKIIDFGTKCVEAAATVAAETSAFEQIMGDYAEQASEKVALIAEATGMVDTRLTTYMTSMTAKFKGLGYDVEEATTYASRGLTLAADAAAFWDKSLDESMSHLNSFINGSYEGGEAIGLFANDTQMALYAVEQGLVADTKEWASLEESIKQATRLEYAENMMALSGATGQAAKEADQYANVKANLNEKWRQFLALVGEPILQNVAIPAMNLAIKAVDGLSSGFEKASDWVSNNKDKLVEWGGYIVGATVTVGTFLLIMNWGQIMSAASAALMLVRSAVLKLNAAIASNPIGAVVSLIAGLIAWLIYLYQTNEDFRNFVNAMFAELWDVMQSVIGWLKENALPIIMDLFNWLKEHALPIIQGMIEFVKNNIIPVVQPIVEWLISAIGDFFGWFTSIFQSTSDSAGGIWETIKGFFQSAWEFIVGVWEACQPFFQGIWDGIILPVAGLVEEMWGAFQMAWDVIKLIWDYVQPYFAGIWEGIKAVFSVVWEVLSLYFKNAWEAIKLVWGIAVEYFKLVWEGIKAVFSVVVTYLGGFFRTAWEAIKAVWDTVIAFFTLVWAGIKAVFAVVKGVLSGDFSDAWEAIKNVWDKAKNFFSTIWNGIENVFGSAGKWFGDTFSAAWNAVKNVFSAWGSFFSGLWDKIKTTFSNIGTNIGNAISSSVKAGINGVISAIEGVINTGVNLINGAIRLINKIPGVSIGSLRRLSLPRLAKGGVVDEPTPAIFGEDGAEAVVPLENNTGWLNKVAKQLHEFSIESRDDLSGVLSRRSVEIQEQQVSEMQTLNDKVDSIMTLLVQFFPEMLEALNIQMYLDTGVLVAESAPAMDTELGKLAIKRGRGR